MTGRNPGESQSPEWMPDSACEEDPLPPAAFEHPKGTLAIVLIYAALFVLGWIALYFGEFLPRGIG